MIEDHVVTGHALEILGLATKRAQDAHCHRPVLFVVTGSRYDGAIATAPLPPLTRIHWLILGFWLTVSVVFAVMWLAASRGETGWEDLLAFVAILFLVFAVAAVVVSWALARYLVSDALARGVILFAGPPALVVFLVFILRIVS